MVEDQSSDGKSLAWLQASGVGLDIARQIDSLISGGYLSKEDLSENVFAELATITINVMVQIADEIKSSDLSHLKNMSAYLIGLIKSHKKKMPAVQTEEATDVSSQIIIGKRVNKTNALGPNETAIKALLAKTGYKLEITQGQRQYGPPPNWSGPPPPRGCEIFIGGLLRETYEDGLIPMLEQCGNIYDLRIMTNPDGTGKGFAFCIFTTKEEAKTAVQKLDGRSMNRSRVLKVNVHCPNTRLFVGGVEKNKSKEEIMSALLQYTEGVTDVILKPDSQNPNQHRGFVFVDYIDHKHASLAFKRFTGQPIKLFNKTLFADWAEPQTEIPDEVMATVKVLYVTGISQNVTEEVLSDRFSPYGEIESVKKIKDYAFVHFKSRENAMQAMNDLNGQKIEDSTIEVTLAKPAHNQIMKKKEGGRRDENLGERPRHIPPPMSGMGAPRGGGRGGHGREPLGGRSGPLRPGPPRPRDIPERLPERLPRFDPYDDYPPPPASRYDDAYRPPPAPMDRYERYGSSIYDEPSYRDPHYDGYSLPSDYRLPDSSYPLPPRPMPSRGSSRPPASRGAARGPPTRSTPPARSAPPSRGASNSRGGGQRSLPPPRGGATGLKRSSDYSNSSGGASFYENQSYGAPDAKKAKALSDWAVKPIAQQPLSKYDSGGYGATPSYQEQSWYSDSW